MYYLNIDFYDWFSQVIPNLDKQSIKSDQDSSVLAIMTSSAMFSTI